MERMVSRRRCEPSGTDGVRKPGGGGMSAGLNKYLEFVLLCVYVEVYDHTLRLQSIPPVFIFCLICPSRPHYPRFLSYSTTLVLSSVAYVCLYLCHICIWHTNSLQKCVRSSQKCRSKHHLFVSVSHCLTHAHTQWLCFISGVAGEADMKIDKMEFNGRRRKLLA